MSEIENAPNVQDVRDKQRPTPKVVDHESIALGLSQWFAQLMPAGKEFCIEGLNVPDGAGMSNVTLLFDLKWRDASGAQSRGFVVRMNPPAGNKTIFSATDYDMRLQYNAMQCLTGKARVPTLVGIDEHGETLGLPFYVMERIEGRVPPDLPPMHMAGWVHDLLAADQERLWWAGMDAMCDLHRIDAKSLDLAFLDFPERGATLLERILKRWSDYFDWALEGMPHEDLEHARRWLYDNQPAAAQSGMCWGDARLANVMFAPDKFEALALLDWEMCTLGNPVLDLAWWVFLDRALSSFLPERLPGFPAEDETVRYWARATGLSTDDFHYYKVLAAFAFGAIVSRSMICAPQAVEDPVASNFVLPLARELIAEAS